MSTTKNRTALTHKHSRGITQRMRIAIPLLLALASGCTLNTQVDVNTGQEGDGDSTTGLGATSFGEVTGEPATTTADSSESSGATTGEALTGSTGEESTGVTSEDTGGTSTGEHTDCPDGTVGMEDFRCTCDLGNGEKRAIDPAECGCDLTWGPMGGDCECDGADYPLVSCGWECTAATGSCMCGDIPAPITWCGGTPEGCESDIEIDVWARVERCVCVNPYGLPNESTDPALCGCLPVEDGCECDGITYEPWVCGWPCTTQEDLSCICGTFPAPQSACALP